MREYFNDLINFRDGGEIGSEVFWVGGVEYGLREYEAQRILVRDRPSDADENPGTSKTAGTGAFQIHSHKTINKNSTSSGPLTPQRLNPEYAPAHIYI